MCFYCKKTKEFTIFCFIETSSFSEVLEGQLQKLKVLVLQNYRYYLWQVVRFCILWSISVQVSSTQRCCLRYSEIGCHVSNRNNQHNSLRDAIKCWPIDLSRTELIFLISEELHLHNKTVVAEADGVVENSRESWAGEVAEGEGWGEQAGYQALHLVRRQAFLAVHLSRTAQ